MTVSCTVMYVMERLIAKMDLMKRVVVIAKLVRKHEENSHLSSIWYWLKQFSPLKPFLGQFQCAHGKKCIDATFVCDGKPHCQDRSDEMDCFKRTKSCSHRCDNKTRCIPENFLCDGERDCADGTDELDCGKTFNYAYNSYK